MTVILTPEMPALASVRSPFAAMALSATISPLNKRVMKNVMMAMKPSAMVAQRPVLGKSVAMAESIMAKTAMMATRS